MKTKIKLPARPPKPTLAYVTIRVYNHENFRSIVPEEATISYPVPDHENGEPVVKYFHYWDKSYPKRHVTRPMTFIVARVKPEPEWAEIIRYETAQPGDPLFSEIADPTSPPPEPLSGSERRELETTVYVTCQMLLTGKLEEAREAEQAYVAALRRLVWPGLLPFYRALNPEFAERVRL